MGCLWEGLASFWMIMQFSCKWVTTASVPLTQPPSISRFLLNTTRAPTFRTNLSGSLSLYLWILCKSASRSGCPWWSVSSASYTTSQPSTISMQAELISVHSERVLQITTVLSSSISAIFLGWSLLFSTLVTSSSHTPILTLLSTLQRTGSVARFTSLRHRTENLLHRVVAKMSLCPTAGSWAGSPSRMTCLPPHGLPENAFLLYFLHRPSDVRNRNQSSILNSSIIRTSVFLNLATWTVPSSNEELYSISRAKQLWTVVPLIKWAATPLGASLLTTRFLDLASSISPFSR